MEVQIASKIQIEIINHLTYLQTKYHALNPVERKLAIDKLRMLRDRLQEEESAKSPDENNTMK